MRESEQVVQMRNLHLLNLTLTFAVLGGCALPPADPPQFAVVRTMPLPKGFSWAGVAVAPDGALLLFAQPYNNGPAAQTVVFRGGSDGTVTRLTWVLPYRHLAHGPQIAAASLSKGSTAKRLAFST